MDDGHTREEKMDEKPEKTISSRASGESAKQWSEEEERAVRRKMDVRLLPLLTSLYLVCFIDRFGPTLLPGTEGREGVSE